MIEPTRLRLPDLPGLNADAIRAAAGPGLFVLVGQNNSGKTRLLRGIQAAMHQADITNDLLALSSSERSVLGSWARMGETLTLSWQRDMPVPDASAEENKRRDHQGAVFVDQATLPPSLRQLDETARNTILSNVRRLSWTQLKNRRAITVPTNRHFPPLSPLHGDLNPQDPSNWAGFLFHLATSNEPTKVRTFESIAASFEHVSEGARLHCRSSRDANGQFGARIQISLPHEEERSLELCGDGLRDLAGIFLLASCLPNHDLMLDEPGLRLHPSTQRRLVEFLANESKKRAIWIASHDGATVGSPHVSRRFEVRRVPGEDRSEVRELLNQGEARRALYDLGWSPEDAFLSDRILFGEGESDVIAFEAAKNWLVEDGEPLEGTLLADLGGCGFVFQGKASQAPERVALARKAAPHVQLVALIDNDARSQSEVQAARNRLENLGIRIEILPCVELENLWMDAPLLLAMLRDYANARGGDASGISAEAIRDVLEAHDVELEKGSDILEDVASHFGLKIGKTDAARLAVRHLREQSPANAETLKTALLKALRGME